MDNQPTTRKSTTTIVTALMLLPILSALAPPAAATGGLWSPGVIAPGIGAVDGDDLQNRIRMAADPDGNVFSAYDAWNGTGYTIILNRYVQGAGWTGGFQFGLPEWSYNPAITTDSHGNALVAFTYYNQTLSKYVLGAAFYTPLGGWGGFREFSSNATYSSITGEIKVALDDRGVGYIAFLAWNGTGYQPWATWAGLYGGQGTEEVLAGFGNVGGVGPLAGHFDVDGDPAGGSMVVFSAYTGSSYAVYAVRYDRTGWGPVQTLDSRGGIRGFPNIAFDASGRALVTWAYASAAIYSAPWDPATGWGPNVTALSTGNPYYPDLAMAPNGVAVVTHLRWAGSYWAPGAIRYSPGTGWTGAAFLAEQLNSGTPPQVTIDDTGSAVVLFRSAGTGVIRGAEFTQAGWDPAGDMVSYSSSTQIDPVVVSMGHGRAMAAARVYTGANYDAFVSTFTAPDTAAPWATIDTPFDGASFGGGSALVTGWSEPGAQVTVNGASALTFPNGSYEVTVPLAEGVNTLRARAVDAAGNAGLSNTRTVTQTSPAPLLDAERRQAGASGWLEVQHIDNLSLGSLWWARVASDAQGNAWASWYETSAGRNSLYAVRYTRGVGWGTPEQMRVFNAGSTYDTPLVAVTPQGNALFLWNQWNASGANVTLWARLWLTSGGWQEAVRLDNSSSFAYQLGAAASPDGQLGAVWRQQGTLGSSTVHTQLWSPTGGWSPAEMLSNASNITHVPKIAFNATGTAYVTAAIRASGADNLVLYTRAPGGAWTAGTVLTSETTYIGSGGAYILAPGARANFTVSWMQVNGSVLDWRAGRFVNGSWAGAQTVFVNAWSWLPEVVVDAEGYSYIAQTESAMGVGNARVAVAPPGQPFGAPFLLDNGTEHGGGPNLLLHADTTNVSVLWDEVEDGLSRGNMRTYDKATATWGSVVRQTPDYMRAHIPHATAMPDGGMMVVWLRYDFDLGLYQVDARRFVPQETVPPSLTVTAPSPSFASTVDTVRVSGVAEAGAHVTVNGVVGGGGG
ncbi:MAG TPA: hypothetical protein VGB42_11065, partial [Candidatus Thermoplasmatota archaeon]